MPPPSAQDRDRDLLEALAKKPHDSELRLVIADALLERGGSRAELVTLENEARTKPLDKKSARRMRALIDEYAGEWAGALDPWFLRDNRCFESGFLVAGVLSTTKGLVAALEHSAWRIVRDIELPHDARIEDILAVLAHPNMVSLRGLHGLSEQTARALTTKNAAGLATIETLGIRHIGSVGGTARYELGDAPALPHVSRLVVDCRAARGWADWDSLTAGGLGQRVGQLEILSGGDIVGWLRRVEASAIETLAMNVGSEGGAYAASGGWRLALDVRSWRMKATWIDGEAMEKPTSDGLWKMLVSWRNQPDRAARLEVDEATLQRTQPAERSKIEGIVQHVEITVDGRDKKRAEDDAKLQMEGFTSSHLLFVNAKTQRFYLEVHLTLYTGKLGDRRSVKEVKYKDDLAKQMRAKGFGRVRSLKKMVEVLRLVDADVPPFLATGNDTPPGA